jgi:hypothetical protein
MDTFVHCCTALCDIIPSSPWSIVAETATVITAILVIAGLVRLWLTRNVYPTRGHKCVAASTERGASPLLVVDGLLTEKSQLQTPFAASPTTTTLTSNDSGSVATTCPGQHDESNGSGGGDGDDEDEDDYLMLSSWKLVEAD